MKKFLIMLLLVCLSVTYAGSIVSFASSSSDPLGWMQPKEGEPGFEDSEQISGNMRSMGRTLFSIIQEAAFIISVIILVFCGVRIMLSRGNAQKKAEVWDSLKYWVLGSAIVFGVTTIIKILQATVGSFQI